jgi:uncharacterized protein YabE (DUF348 family)/3D (Asp-Asp-Asp) domain-containing protein
MLLLTSIAGVGLLALYNTRPALSLTIQDGDATLDITTEAQTVAEVLAEAGVTLQPGDLVQPPPDARPTAGGSIQITRARAVTLIVDGQAQALRTLFTNPLDILNEAAVQPGPIDRLWLDGTRAQPADLLKWSIPVTTVELQRAVEIVIVDDGASQTLHTAADTVAEALTEAGITLFEADRLTPDVATPLSNGLQVQITRAAPVSIIANGQTLTTRALGGTIADALGQVGVTLGELDYSVPSAEVAVQPGLVVRVIRVTEEVITADETIPFELIYQADSNRELDQVAVVQAGQNGTLRGYTRVRYENGVEISRTPDRAEVIAEAVNQIVVYGTNVVIRVVDTPEGPREYWRIMRLYATSYHPAALGGDNVTATGRILTKGIVGIDPTLIPYGSQMYVPGYGLALAADTGIRRRKLWIDLGYDDANWISWSRYVDVYMLTPVPPEIDYILPEL